MTSAPMMAVGPWSGGLLHVYNFQCLSFLIAQPLQEVGRLIPKPKINHSGWMAVIAQTDRHESVRNRYCGVFVFYENAKAFCHTSMSYLYLFLIKIASFFFMRYYAGFFSFGHLQVI